MSVDVVILGGGNMGDMEATLQRAEELIAQQIGAVSARSEVLKSEAWGFECSHPFSNRAWMATTELEPMEVMERLLAIEAQLGRDRKAEYREKVLGGQNYAARVIDLDILLYGQQVVVTPHLQIPHPMLLKRDFAIAPLCQVLGIDSDSCVELISNIVRDEI